MVDVRRDVLIDVLIKPVALFVHIFMYFCFSVGCALMFHLC
jgi:hypothetical protein